MLTIEPHVPWVTFANRSLRGASLGAWHTRNTDVFHDEPSDPPETVDDDPIVPVDMAHEEYDLHDIDQALAEALGVRDA